MPGYASLGSVAALPSVFLNPLSIVRACGFQLGNRVICRSRAENALDGWSTTVNNPCLFNEMEFKAARSSLAIVVPSRRVKKRDFEPLVQKGRFAE